MTKRPTDPSPKAPTRWTPTHPGPRMPTSWRFTDWAAI